MEQQYLTAKDIAKELSISLARAYEITKECLRVVTGRSVRVSREAFEAWKRRHEEAPCPSTFDTTATPSSSSIRVPRSGGCSSPTRGTRILEELGVAVVSNVDGHG